MSGHVIAPAEHGNRQIQGIGRRPESAAQSGDLGLADMSPRAADGGPREAIAGARLHPAAAVRDRKPPRHERVGHAAGPLQHGAIRRRHGEGERFAGREHGGRHGGGVAGADYAQRPSSPYDPRAAPCMPPTGLLFDERHRASRRAGDAHGSARHFRQHLLMGFADQRTARVSIRDGSAGSMVSTTVAWATIIFWPDPGATSVTSQPAARSSSPAAPAAGTSRTPRISACPIPSVIRETPPVRVAIPPPAPIRTTPPRRGWAGSGACDCRRP